MCVYMCTCIYVCVYGSVCMYMCMYVYMCVHMCICICMYMYICMEIYYKSINQLCFFKHISTVNILIKTIDGKPNKKNDKKKGKKLKLILFI